MFGVSMAGNTITCYKEYHYTLSGIKSRTVGDGQLHDAPVQEMVVAEDIDYDRMPHKRAPYNLPRQEVDR